MKNEVKCIKFSFTYVMFTQNRSLTIGKYYEYKNINYRRSKIYIKNDKGIFKYYPLEWFDFGLKESRRIKLTNILKV